MENNQEENKYFSLQLDKGRVSVLVGIFIAAILIIFFFGYYIGEQSIGKVKAQINADDINNVDQIEKELYTKKHSKVANNSAETDIFEDNNDNMKIDKDDKEMMSIERELLSKKDNLDKHSIKDKVKEPKIKEKKTKKHLVHKKKRSVKNKKKRKITKTTKKIKRHRIYKIDPYLKGTRYAIQIMSVETERAARKKVRELRRLGYKAYYFKSKIGEEIYFRVRVGPFGSHRLAKKYLKKLREDEGMEETYIVKR